MPPAEAFKMYLSRAKKAIDSGRFPQDTLEVIERDMDRTLPQLKLFIPGSPMRDDLREVLCAWVVYRSDDGLGYVRVLPPHRLSETVSLNL